MSEAAGKPGIPVLPENSSAPLTPAQERIWNLHEIDPQNPGLNVAMAWEITGDLELEKLETALNKMVARHAVLRSRISSEDSGLVQTPQLFENIPPVHLEIEQLTDVPPGKTLPPLGERYFSRVGLPFLLDAPPHMRAVLFKAGPEKQILLLIFPQIVMDGEARNLLVSELIDHYEGRAVNSLPVQYPDYAAWIRSELSEKRLSTLTEYWRSVFREAYRPMPIPASAAKKVETAVHTVGKEWAGRVDGFSRKHSITPFALYTTAYQTVLSSYAQQPEAIIFFSAAGRTQRELQPLLGLFAR